MRRIVLAAVVIVCLSPACVARSHAFRPELRLHIVEPRPGAHVTAPLTVRVSTDASLKPGDRLLRVFVDGIPVATTSNRSFPIETLSPGPHAIHVSVINPDGSPAGADAEVKVDAGP